MRKFYMFSISDFDRKFPNLERDCNVFRDYYSHYQKFSFKELGEKYGLSIQRVSQIIWRKARRLIAKEEFFSDIKNC